MGDRTCSIHTHAHKYESNRDVEVSYTNVNDEEWERESLNPKRVRNDLLCRLSNWELCSPWSLAHISWGVPCKSPVTQNKLLSLWMGQNNTEMSLFRCNWSYLGKHKSIVSIIAMSPGPQRFFHEGFSASLLFPVITVFISFAIVGNSLHCIILLPSLNSPALGKHVIWMPNDVF